jgi:hypothetical protein
VLEDEEDPGADDEIVVEGLKRSEENLGICAEVAVQDRVALPVKNADVKRSCVQVDPAVVLVLSGVESHGLSPPGLSGH